MTVARRVPRHRPPVEDSFCRVVLLFFLTGLLLVTSACSSPVPVDGQARVQQQENTSAPAGLAPYDPIDCPPPTVSVGTAAQLNAALASAAPGTVIAMADGIYDGEFTATAGGTAQAPIWLCGSKQAVLRGRGIDHDAVLSLQQVRQWRLVGFTVRDGQKGVLADGVTASTMQDLTVTEIGHEGVHLRSGSSGNVLRGLVISATGLRDEKFGEGIYVGSARATGARCRAASRTVVTRIRLSAARSATPPRRRSTSRKGPPEVW